MYNVYTGLLKMMNDFRDDGESISIKYILNDKCNELCEQYNIDDIAGIGDTFGKANNLLTWISKNIYHKGDYDNHVQQDALSLLDYSFKKGKECGINCTALSSVLSQCLSALGIKSRVLKLIPFSPYDLDCHVVCEAYMEELRKWVMLDPTFGTYVTDDNNVPLGIMEIRSRLAEQKEITFSETAHYNGGTFSAKDTTEYYAKNLFSVEIAKMQGAFVEKSQVIAIVPLGFDMKKREKINTDFALKQLGNVDWALKLLKEIENQTYIYKDSIVLK